MYSASQHSTITLNVIMLGVAFYFLLCWVTLYWVLLCWVSWLHSDVTCIWVFWSAQQLSAWKVFYNMNGWGGVLQALLLDPEHHSEIIFLLKTSWSGRGSASLIHTYKHNLLYILNLAFIENHFVWVGETASWRNDGLTKWRCTFDYDDKKFYQIRPWLSSSSPEVKVIKPFFSSSPTEVE